MDKKLHDQIVQVCDLALKAGGVQILQCTVDVISFANNSMDAELLKRTKDNKLKKGTKNGNKKQRKA